MSVHLMTSRRFAPLFWCQFFSAFNDNFLKNALGFLIVFHIGGDSAASLNTLALAIFIAPFFILSGLGGQLADRFDKAVVARYLKLVEIFVVGIAIAGFATRSLPLLFVALALFGTIAALFGPIKYGILPDHLAREDLAAGNALIEAATFMAILLGTIIASFTARDGGSPVTFGALIMTFAVLCWVSSLMIPRAGEGAPSLAVQWNIVSSTADLLKHLWADSRLRWGGIVTSWFWLVGAVVLSLLLPLVKNVLNGTEDVGTLFLGVFAVAIAVGSSLAAWLSAGRTVLLPTVVGAVLLGLFALDLGWATYSLAPATIPMGVAAVLASPPGLRIAIDLAGLAISGGLFIVPSFAAVQAWAGVDHRARVIAACNVLNAGFMTLGTPVVGLLQSETLLGRYALSTSTLFLIVGVTSLVVAIAIARTMPTSALPRPPFDRLSGLLPPRREGP
jgi:acyl-[acyl-carrier-protein]-phospholipid O-acyltransferase / long-chain-fatty-acid--[acyl-carrier-protein] ligase